VPWLARWCVVFGRPCQHWVVRYRRRRPAPPCAAVRRCPNNKTPRRGRCPNRSSHPRAFPGSPHRPQPCRAAPFTFCALCGTAAIVALAGDAAPQRRKTYALKRFPTEDPELGGYTGGYMRRRRRRARATTASDCMCSASVQCTPGGLYWQRGRRCRLTLARCPQGGPVTMTYMAALHMHARARGRGYGHHASCATLNLYGRRLGIHMHDTQVGAVHGGPYY